MAVNEIVVNSVTELSLVNDTVSEETLLEDTTAHDASGNLIVGKAKYINPNLIINPDFSINQRGLTEYSGNGIYSVDMWHSFGCKVVPKENGGVDLYLTDGADYFSIDQLFESLLETGHYAASFAVDGKVYSGTGYLSSEEAGFGVTFEGGRCEVWKNRVQFYFDSIESASLDYVKLELGSVATPFVPPDPAVELAKCQRYFRTLSRGVHVEYAGTNGTDVVIRVPFEVPMRVTPTCFIMNHNVGLHYCNGWVESSTELTILNSIATRYGITLLHVSGFNLSGLNLQIGQNLALNSDNVFGISAEL